MTITEKYRKLFEPGTIGNMWLKNRLAMAPMQNGLVDNDGVITDQGIDYYEERAKGGVGLIITAGITTCSKFEPFRPGRMEDSKLIGARLNQLAERLHDYSCKLCLQLNAGLGRIAAPASLAGRQPVSASATTWVHDPSITCKALAPEEVQVLVRSFYTAAQVCQVAGVDAIEIIAHEGYLFDQFMTSLWNKRNDRYGGATLRERMTFPLEVIEAIHQATGGTMPIIFRFGLTHKSPGGRTEEEGLEICQIVEDAGVAALDIDAGWRENTYWPHPTMYQPPALMLDLAAKAKQVVKRVAVMCVGRMHYPDIAAQALEEGKADFVIIGRGLLADPEWPNKTRKGKVDEIRPCIGCGECSGRYGRGLTIGCAVNGACGNERMLRLSPAEQRKKVVVVGGGPAGMEAARVAKLRGHEVTLYEKSGELGGNLIPASVPEFKQDLRLLKKYYENEMKRLGVNLFLNTEAAADKILEAKPDVVFLATGAVPGIPVVPGIDSPKVATAIDVLKGKATVGENIVIVGGGLVGCELAVYLAQKGKKVSIVAMTPRVARVADDADMAHVGVGANWMVLLKMLEESGVAMLTDNILDEVTKSGVRVVDKNFKKWEMPADSVVIATPLVSPQDNLYEALQEKVEEVYRLGDCVTPAKIIDAIRPTYRKARLV